MESYEVTEIFSSLAQETRLKVFKLLIEYGNDGLVPREIAKELGIPDNTLSFHLSHMSKTHLVSSRKNGRSITYFANTTLMNHLVQYLKENCCSREKASRSQKSCNERSCS